MLQAAYSSTWYETEILFTFRHMPLLRMSWLITFCEFKEVIAHQNSVGV